MRAPERTSTTAATLLALAALSFACGGNETSASDSGVDVTVDVPASACTVYDAALNSAYSSTDAAAGCLPSWGDYGAAGPCTVVGQVCVYPEGQAVCENHPPDGQYWSVATARSGCDELPPSQCTPCSLTPGGVCTYLNGPGASVTFCCDGNLQQWDLLPEGGCPNGKTCGAIHAADYDQTCTTGADCALVIQGDLCTLGCTNCRKYGHQQGRAHPVPVRFRNEAERAAHLPVRAATAASMQGRCLQPRSVTACLPPRTAYR